MAQLGNIPPGLPNPPGNVTGILSWASAMVSALSRELGRLFHEANQQPKCPEFLTANIPAPGDWKGRIIFVSDAAVGARFQGSTGAAWVNLG